MTKKMEIVRTRSELASHSSQQRTTGRTTRLSFKEVIMQALGIKYVGLVMNPLFRNLLHDELERIVPHIVHQVEFAVRQQVGGELQSIISQAIDQTALVMRQQIREEMMNAIIQINNQTDGIVVRQGEPPLIAHASHLLRTPRLHIEEAGPAAPNLQLSFQKKLQGTTFYAEECIKDEDNNNLQVALTQIESGQIFSSPLGFPVEVEIVVTDGDFPGASSSEWSTDDLNSKIVKEREGKKPLLCGASKAILHEGIASFGEIKLTDSSILVKSREFKLGAKVSNSSHFDLAGMIKPAVTERFKVLAERSKQHKKNYPPSLDDELFRLRNIGRKGKYMKQLADHNITTVRDFLKLFFVDPEHLQKITNMSIPMFNDTVKHANTCNKGEDLYTHSRESFELILNSVCEVQSIMIDGVHCQLEQLTLWQKECVKELVSEAYNKWDNLERFYGTPSFPVSQNTTLTGTGGHTNGLEQLPPSQIGNAQEHWNPPNGSNGASSSGIIEKQQNDPSLDFSCQDPDPFLGAHNHWEDYLNFESYDTFEPCQT